MFLVSAAAGDKLLSLLHQTKSQIDCGLLLGKKQGDITLMLSVPNVAGNPDCEWQLDPVQLARELTRTMQADLILQGIYYTDTGQLPAPTAEMIKRWRYNVPCFVISLSQSGAAQVCAFAIDPILQKATEVLVLMELAQTTKGQTSPVAVQRGAPLGMNVQTGEEMALSYQARKLSTYVIGAMGMGKTTLLLNLILSDIARGDGVCVLDPHGDLTQDILGRIPARREEDVVVWEPFDVETPLGLNLFACADVTNANLVDQVSSQVVGTFYKLFHDSWGPQMENLLRVTALTLIYNQDLPPAQRPTMVEIPALWNDALYRAFLVNRVPNPVVREFWQYTYNPLKRPEQQEYHRSSINKITRFILNDTIRNIVGQAESSFDLRQMMDEGKIFLVNLSKGKLGEDNSNLLGSILVGKLLTAALSRADIPFAQRRPFHLVVDEYQNFATKTFTTLQTEARKFAIDTIVAHQTRAMLEEESKGATSAVGNLISFAVTGTDAQEIAVMLDNTPPEPPVVGVQPIRTLSASPWDHLVRNGHSNPQVNELVAVMQAALTPIPKRKLPDFNNPPILFPAFDVALEYLQSRIPISQVRQFITEEDVRRFEDLLNIYLHKRMNGVVAGELEAELHSLQEIGPFYSFFRYYKKPGHLVVNVGKEAHEYVVYGKDESIALQEYQGEKQAEFYDALEKLAQALAVEPILADSGQYQEIRDKPRLYSDVTAETANTLRTLKPYHALCRMIDEDGNRIQCCVKTYPAAPIAGVGMAQATRIRTRSKQCYGRSRLEVERDLAGRRTLVSKLQSAQPPPTAGVSAEPASEQADATQPTEPESFWEKTT